MAAITEIDKRRIRINNISFEVRNRLGGVAVAYDSKDLLESFKELNICINLLYELKREILFIKNTKPSS